MASGLRKAQLFSSAKLLGVGSFALKTSQKPYASLQWAFKLTKLCTGALTRIRGGMERNLASRSATS